MQVSERGVAFIAAHEGIVTRAYRDVAGVWTIGVGHTAAAGPPVPKQGMSITRAEALAILARDLPRYEKRVAAALPGCPQTVFDAAVSFDFNTGGIHRASWVPDWKAGRREAARLGLMKWVRAGGRTVTGLVRRRESEWRLLATGDYGNSAAIPVASDAVKAWQRQLAALGFFDGAIDGIAGRTSREAVLAYQRSHPDLVADGIVGPATRASLARDLALRKTPAVVAGTAAGTAGAAGAAAEAGGIDPAAAAAIAAACLVLLLVAGLAWHYRGELRRLLGNWKGNPA